MLCFSGKECSEFPKKVLVLIGILKQDSGKKAILAAGYSGNIASGMEYREFTPSASDQNNCRRYDSGMLPFDGSNLPGMYIMRPDTDEQSIF